MTRPSVSPSSGSSNSSDASEIDELDYRSRKLSNFLKKNVNSAEQRKSVLDVVRSKAWLLENQVKQLEKETKKFRNSLERQPCSRRVLLLLLLLFSATLVYLGIKNASTNIE